MTTPTPVETPLRLLVAGVAIMLASCTDADLPSEPAVPDPGGNFHAAQALLETSSIRGFAGLGPSIHSTFADLDSGAAHVPMPLQLIGKTLEYSPTIHRSEFSERLGVLSEIPVDDSKSVDD